VIKLLLALATAGLLIVTFPRFGVAWLAAVALAPLLVAVAQEPGRLRRFLLGWAAGIVFWAGACYWIQGVLYQHGGLGLAASWAAFALFSTFKALHMGVFALLAGFLMPRAWAVLTVPALWVAIERTHGPLGFAWLALGNAGIDMSLPMRLAPLTGVYGLSFVFAMLGTALALAILRRPRREMAPVLVLPLLYLLPALPPPRAGAETAVLVQPNIDETADWTPQWVEQTHQQIAALSLTAAGSAGGPQLLVWPEVPAPMYYYANMQFRDMVNDIARRTGAYFLLNVVAHTPEGSPLNSALLVGPEGSPLGRYDKMFLVPFGEFVPWPFGFVSKISTESGDFAAGKVLQTLPAGAHQIGAFICYESAFPHLVRRFAANGGELFVNISNDGWYGRSAARDQHLRIVRMRAAENRRWILRATNNGITATIDPAGRISPALPSYSEAAVRTRFSYVASKTPYTRFGDWFVLACAAVATAGIAVSLLPVYRPE
jgi:apolipoprotein N-acyltransferase